MKRALNLYFYSVMENPLIGISAVLCVLAGFLFFVPDFRLDASADSLVLEDDQDLKYFREILKRYGGDGFLVITYTPEKDLFSPEVVQTVADLKQEILSVKYVSSVFSMLDVPLLNSPKVKFSELQSGVRKITDEGMDIELARKELTTSPFYSDLVVNDKGTTTAMMVRFETMEEYYELLYQRNELREQKWANTLSVDGMKELRSVEKSFRQIQDKRSALEHQAIEDIRQLVEKYKVSGRLFLGGVPMITADMISFIKSDLKIFGAGLILFLIVTLAVIFRQLRWIGGAMLTCITVSLVMVGMLGFLEWSLTVISSNFISLLLVITMSMTMHLTVRYREIHVANPGMLPYKAMKETVEKMWRPCLYTSLTTIVAFSSLVVSGIRPVMDFGWMMTVGIAVSFLITFVLFPAFISILPERESTRDADYTQKFTLALAHISIKFKKILLLVVVITAALSVYGISLLSVDNRFIDYFGKNTEIYQGMLEIDQNLGGTTPLDIIIDAPADYLEQMANTADDDFSDSFDDPFEDDPFAEEDSKSPLEDSYWYKPSQLKELEKVHDYLDSLPQTGKVLSLSTTIKVATEINDGKALNYFQLMLLQGFVPDELKANLLKPYLSEDGNQVRLSVRLIETDPNLKRQEFLDGIYTHLTEELGFERERVHLTGMAVLYNNMLQSLYESQILTLGAVFVGIMLMFLILFKSIRIACIGILPNLLSALFILGFMGVLGIPLDFMTITIAAITIGIAVDDTIHYVFRLKEELSHETDYEVAVKRSHASIGKAMYYTSLTIIVGFSILALSNFWPTIYFGLLTGLAMFIALLANLTVLPSLFLIFKPVKPEG